MAASVARLAIPRETAKGIACILIAWRRNTLTAVERDIPSSSNSFSIAACVAIALSTVTMWRQADAVREREDALDEEGKVLLDITGMSTTYDFYGIYYDDDDNS